MWLPPWAWMIVRRHIIAKRARPAIRWMNRFAVIGLMIGVFAWISTVSIMNGLQGDIRNRSLKEKPHLIWEGSPREGLESRSDELRAKLKGELKSLRFVLQSEGLLEVPSKQKGRATGSGVVIQGLEGLGDKAEIGVELASVLDLRPRDEFKLRSVWKLDQAPLILKSEKTFETGVYELDRAAVRIDRKKMEEWLGLKQAASRIEIQLADPFKAEKFKTEVSKVFSLEFKSWEETEASLWYSLKLEKTVMSLAIFFIVLLASLAVHLALSVRVAEKNREIALLRGLGSSQKILSRIYLTEGIVLGFCGSFCGLWVSWLFCKLVSGYLQLPSFYYSTSVPVEWSWWGAIQMALVALFLAVLASWSPAARVGNIEIQEALRS